MDGSTLTNLRMFSPTPSTLLFTITLTLTTSMNTGAAESRTVIAERRCKFGSRLAFEKTTGYELIRASPKRLFSDRDGGIVGECARKCEEDARCQGCLSITLFWKEIFKFRRKLKSNVLGNSVGLLMDGC